MLTSALVETVRDFKTRLPHCKICPKTPKLRLENNALRGIRTPPLHLPPPFKCLLSTPPALRKHIQEFSVEGKSEDQGPSWKCVKKKQKNKIKNRSPKHPNKSADSAGM